MGSFRRTHLSLITGMLTARSVCSDAGRTESMLSVASVAIFRLLGFLVQRGLSRLRQQHALLRMSQEPHTIGNLAAAWACMDAMQMARTCIAASVAAAIFPTST